jgi:predicted 3-demethylubiquinone-9 3-methyltransferase (glyoxalase superfamily)
MALSKHKITPCLWFDSEAEEAAKFYVSVFKNSKLGKISRYGKAGQEIHGKKPGSVMVAEFEIDGQPFVALNGGPQFKFSEAVSFQVHCDIPGRDRLLLECSDQGGPRTALRLAEG